MIRRSLRLLLPILVAVAPLAARAEITYDTKFTGVDSDVEAALEGASQLVALADKAPDTEAALRRRAETDAARLKQVMEAEGYYDATLSVDVQPGKDPDSYTVTVTADAGKRYTLAAVEIHQPDGSAPPEFDRFLLSAFGLTLGQPALSAPVAAAEGRIARAYAERGWPFARVSDRNIIVDTATKTMHVNYTLDLGKPGRFGPVAIDGLTKLDKLYVERRVKWQQGMPYDQGLVDDTRQTLVTSGLFGSVIVQAAGQVGPDGQVPMEIKLSERSLHTIGAGASYDTTLGAEVNLSWEDRDLFGYAEDLSVVAKGGQSDSGLTVKFVEPDIFWLQQDFVASVSFANQLEEAFRSLNQEIQLGFQQKFSPTLTGGYSVLAEHARVDEKTDYRVYTLVGLPLYLREDGSDDLLNPTRGYRAGIEVTPYLGALGSDTTYTQAKLTASTYRKLDDRGNYVLAVQGIFGTSCCASLDAIPKDHRFYAGGGGTVRGFGYQKAGPLDEFDNPEGGRSLLVGSLELRTKITDTISIVPFLDAGSDYPNPLPDLNSKIYLGAGIGARYFTAIGPLRLDVATPLNPHPVGDSPIQIYVSIGQAF